MNTLELLNCYLFNSKIFFVTGKTENMSDIKKYCRKPQLQPDGTNYILVRAVLT